MIGRASEPSPPKHIQRGHHRAHHLPPGWLLSWGCGNGRVLPLQITTFYAVLWTISFHPPATFSCGWIIGKHLFLMPRELMSCEKRLDGELLLSGRSHLFCSACFFANNFSLNCCVKSRSPCVRFVSLLIKENTIALLKIHPVKWV